VSRVRLSPNALPVLACEFRTILAFRQAARSPATSSFKPSQRLFGQVGSRLSGGLLQSFHRPALCSGSRCSMAKTRKPDEAQQAGGSVSGYFKALFRENPGLLKSTSNEDIFERWLKDHPEEKEVPDRVKGILFNVKSKLRKRGARRGRPRKEAEPTVEGQPAAAAPVRRPATRGLDSLEERIDDCLTLARSLDRDGLGAVIDLLRRARNGVVVSQGR
jgi:hypothetical protein